MDHHGLMNERRAERRAERTWAPEGWKAYRRIDATCRRQANRRTRESWAGICRSLQSARQSSRAWRLFRSLLQVATSRHPVLGAAIARGVSYLAMAEQLADHFSASLTVSVPPLVPLAQPPPGRPPLPAGVTSSVAALCEAPITPHELHRALHRSKQRSAPGADGLTLQMLRNLGAPEQARLLDAFNIIWDSGILPESWSTAIVVPIRKARKPLKALSSYRPVSLTSAACKSMEFVALQRLSWIARASDFLSECQTGFRRHRCTADSIADVVSCLEEAKQQGEVAFLVLLDVQAAFDSLPHSMIEQALDDLGVTGRLRRFVTAFLSNRSMQVRVGGTLSSPRPITAGVPQGSVLSPFLFNLVMAGLPNAIQQDRLRVFCSLYADDIALWVRAPRKHIVSARRALQRALDAVKSFLTSKGLVLSATKSEALLVHPRGARATAGIRTLQIDGTNLPWRQQVRYLGLTIDHRLTWISADNPLLLHLDRVGRTAERLLARGNGCSASWAIRLFEAARTSAVLYALPLVTLRDTRLNRLEIARRKWIRRLLGVPRNSQTPATLAKAGVLPLNLLLLQRGLTHTDRLHHVPDGEALCARLLGRPHSRMGMLAGAYLESLGQPSSHLALPPLPTRPPLQVFLDFRGTSKRRTPAAAIKQAAAAFLEECGDSTLLFTDGSVLPASGRAAAALVAPQLGVTKTCRLSFPGSSTAAELAGLHLAADHMAALPPGPVAVLCDSRPALQLLTRSHDVVATTSQLRARLHALENAGRRITLHWVPGHSGIEGNDLADASAKSAHADGSPVSLAVTQHDFARSLLLQVVRTLHPDRRIAARKPFRRLSDQLPRRDRSLLLRLRIGCTWTPSRLYVHGRASSPACPSCGDTGTLGHLLLACPAHDLPRQRLESGYRALGLRTTTEDDLLFPVRNQLQAHRVLLSFLGESGLSLLL
ncbi:uncharacterized protein LOC144119977 [Amblyomma americanum]